MAKKKTDPNQQTFDLPSVINKFENLSAAVNELRTGIFAPITKISSKSIIHKKFIDNKRERRIETTWGTVVVAGNILTQTHRDILDCVFAAASNDTKELSDGSIAVYFKLADISKALSSKGEDNYNYNWIKQKLKEIQTTAIEFRAKDSKDYFMFNFLSKAAFSEKHGSFGLVFTKEYKQFIESQLTVNYQQELPKLLKVDSALLKAIIRFFWTHKHCNISVEQVLKSIGYPIESDRAIMTARKEIKDNAEILEKEFGIFYNKKENFLYTQTNENITFIPPTTNAHIQLEK